VTFVVDGSSTTLTESTEFDCEGEASEEVCCDNLGAAITTAAIGITPDCDTTAGTCYLTPAARLAQVSITIADGGVNGTGWTVTMGADGNIVFGGVSPEATTLLGSLTFAPLDDLILTAGSGIHHINSDDDTLAWGGGADGDVRMSFTGADFLTLLQAVGSDEGWVISLEDTPPAADGEMIHVWSGTAGDATCSSDATFCLEDDTNHYVHFLAPDANATGLRFGDVTADIEAQIAYGNTSHGTHPGCFRLYAEGNTEFADVCRYTTSYLQAYTVKSADSSTTTATNTLTIQSGDQSNAGNYASGAVTIESGTTTTDGDTGDVTLRTGAAGVGAADAGDILFQTHGSNTRCSIAGNGGDFTCTADADIEGTAAFGNGSALDADRTMIIDRDFSTTTDGSQLQCRGIITVSAGTDSISVLEVAPDGVILDDGGPGVHARIASLEVAEPQVTETVGTVTDVDNVIIGAAATEGATNHSLHVIGDAQFDAGVGLTGTLTVGTLHVTGTSQFDDNMQLLADDKSFAIGAGGAAADCYFIHNSTLNALEVFCGAGAAGGWVWNTAQTGGIWYMADDSYMGPIIDMKLTAGTAGDDRGYCLGLGNTCQLYVFAESDGAVYKQNPRIGILTNTPEYPLEVEDTNAHLSLTSTVAEDTDGGRETRLIFQGTQSGGEETHLGWVEFHHDGAADDEQGEFAVYVNDGNDADAPTLVLSIDKDALATFTGNVALNTGSTASVYNAFAGGFLGFNTTGTATAVATGGLTIQSGDQSNAADHASGDVTLESGTTNTDGDTGDVTIRTGQAGAGVADAGKISFQTHGANERMSISGAGLVSIVGNLNMGENLYLDDDADSYVTGTTTDDVIELYVNDAVGTGYVEVVNSNGAGAFAVGRTSGTESSLLSVTDGGADNEPGLIVQYEDDGNGSYMWVATDGTYRVNSSAPADDDADGYAIINNTTGLIGEADQAMTCANLTSAGRRVITPGSQELSAAETLTITSQEMELYSDGGAVVSTADPALTNGTANGEIICVMGTSDANTIEWKDETDNAGSTLELAGDVAFVMGLGDRLCLRWYATGSKWYETSRSAN
jgi:lipopolysaccharide export system protein LptA